MTNNTPEKNKPSTPEKEFSQKLTFRDYLIATEEKAHQPLPFWRLVAPLLVQVGLILGVPSQAVYTEMAGKLVILQTLPTDVSNLLEGSALSFDYNISRPQTLRRLPGWRDWVRQNSRRNGRIIQGSTLYVILQEQRSLNRQFNSPFDDRFTSDRPKVGNLNSRVNSAVPLAWKPVSISSDIPMYLSNNQVALKGNYQNGSINYGLENYYVSQAQREQIDYDLFQAQQNQRARRRPILVRVKVDSQGNATPTSMWIGDRNYNF